MVSPGFLASAAIATVSIAKALRSDPPRAQGEEMPMETDDGFADRADGALSAGTCGGVGAAPNECSRSGVAGTNCVGGSRWWV